MHKEWFDAWFDTPYYHQLYFNRDEQEAEAFIGRLIEHLKPAIGSRMLDVACGKGRHSLTLANMGYTVTGIDLSHNSIAEANKFAHSNLEFFQHDMRQPFRINYYDYAFNFFTSFGYFRTEREHYSAVRTIAHAVQEGGTVVFDYLNTHYAEDHLVAEQDIPAGDYNFHIKKWMDEQYFYKKIEVEHDDFTEPHIYTEQVAKFSVGDFTDMLAFYGVQVTQVYGDYNLGPYHLRQTPRMIIIGKKIKNL
ncbi:MAG: methyltransferase domain-containing protein [Chitinophagaceae bacterium]|jgi:SAM-dependent methyltransferase|nr:methyltransferase domain-containing protein [Chitinophagaceae bacterium]